MNKKCNNLPLNLLSLNEGIVVIIFILFGIESMLNIWTGWIPFVLLSVSASIVLACCFLKNKAQYITVLFNLSFFMISFSVVIGNITYLWTAIIFTIICLGTLLFFKLHLLDEVIRFAICSIIAMVILFAMIYLKTGILYQGKDRINDFPNCLYFSVVTLTTLGYGDMQPSSQSRPFAAAEALIGYIYLAVIIGLVFSYTNKIRVSGETLAKIIGEDPPELAGHETLKKLSAKAEKLKQAQRQLEPVHTNASIIMAN